mgnify:CR=1 FL=1
MGGDERARDSGQSPPGRLARLSGRLSANRQSGQFTAAKRPPDANQRSGDGSIGTQVATRQFLPDHPDRWLVDRGGGHDDRGVHGGDGHNRGVGVPHRQIAGRGVVPTGSRTGAHRDLSPHRCVGAERTGRAVRSPGAQQWRPLSVIGVRAPDSGPPTTRSTTRSTTLDRELGDANRPDSRRQPHGRRRGRCGTLAR